MLDRLGTSERDLQKEGEGKGEEASEEGEEGRTADDFGVRSDETRVPQYQ